MSEQEKRELLIKIDRALKMSSDKMIETKKRLKQRLIISEDGVIKVIQPG